MALAHGRAQVLPFLLTGLRIGEYSNNIIKPYRDVCLQHKHSSVSCSDVRN